MSSGWRVVCSDGVSRHGDLFATRRDALTWQTFRHVCYLGHHVRREAEFPMESFRLRGDHSPSAVSLTRIELQAAEGPNVGTGAVPSPSPTAPGDLHPTPVPTPSAGAT